MSAPLDQLAAVVRRESGIRVGRAQRASLDAAVRRTAPGMDAAQLLRALAGPDGRSLLDRLIDEVAIKETCFLREPQPLEAIDWPALLHAARGAGSDAVRVWSAACATGEEPWTLALLAAEAFPSPEPPVRVLATDISAAALARAERGVYGPRALRNLPASRVERHFQRVGDRLEVGDRLRRLVDFRRHNLVRDPVPAGAGPFELILCRNVLIYFDRDLAASVAATLEAALSPGGRLLLGSADRLCVPRDRRRGAAVPGRPPRRPARPEPHRRGSPPTRRSRPSPGEPSDRPPAAPLAAALRAADEGRIQDAIAGVDHMLVDDPGNADAYLVRGVTELAAGLPARAIESLRRALYLDPELTLAAFKLGRAHDALGQRDAARRAYERALDSLDPLDTRHRHLLDQIDMGDVAAACRLRIQALARDA
jgi:chemotaxis protein methyltransferase CheR